MFFVTYIGRLDKTGWCHGRSCVLFVRWILLIMPVQIPPGSVGQSVGRRLPGGGARARRERDLGRARDRGAVLPPRQRAPAAAAAPVRGRQQAQDGRAPAPVCAHEGPLGLPGVAPRVVIGGRAAYLWLYGHPLLRFRLHRRLQPRPSEAHSHRAPTASTPGSTDYTISVFIIVRRIAAHALRAYGTCIKRAASSGYTLIHSLLI